MKIRHIVMFVFLNILNSSTNFAQEISWKKYVKSNCIQLSLDSLNDNQLNFLDSCINDHRIIMLGEDQHYQIEINELKGRLVKYLRNNQDFKVIAFEVSMNRFCANNLIKDSLSVFDYSGSLWRAKENMDLFQFIKDSMKLAGIDPASDFRSLYLRDMVCQSDPIISDKIENFDIEMRNLKKFYFQNTKLTVETYDGEIKYLTNLYFEDPNSKFNEFKKVYNSFPVKDSLLKFEKIAKKAIVDIDSVTSDVYRTIKQNSIADYDSVFLPKYLDNKKVFVQMLLNTYDYYSRDSLMGLPKFK